MQKVVPNLWSEGVAKEAVDFYTTIFPDTRITGASYYPESTDDGLAEFQTGLAGKELTVEFEIAGYQFTAINAGPEFVVNPSISFMLNFDPSRDENARANLDKLWAALVDGGEVLMELGEYPYSKRYGWVKDRYGVTWQLMLTNPEGEPRPFIIPSLMFTRERSGKAEEAIHYYLETFRDSKLGSISKYPDPAQGVMFADFMIEGQWFAAMDSGLDHDFTFNEGVSLVVFCEDQAEIDYYWSKLSAYPENEQCGWCKDKYGVSWQVVPKDMEVLMERPDAFKRMMEMKKLVITDF